MTLNLPQVPFILFIDQQIESRTWKSSHNVKNPTEHVMKGTTTPTIFSRRPKTFPKPNENIKKDKIDEVAEKSPQQQLKVTRQ